MEYLDQRIIQSFERADVVNQSVFYLTVGFMLDTEPSLDRLFTAEEVSHLKFRIGNDQIHKDFDEQFNNILYFFSKINEANYINSKDLETTEKLLHILHTYNQLVLQESGTILDDNLFLRKLDSFYSEYLSQRQHLSPITKGLVEITHSSSIFWRDFKLENTPDFISVSSDHHVIPAIIMRVVIKDAIGAVEGLLIDNLRHRYDTNNWDWDSGKFTEEEAIEAMIWGALLNSGGFLARHAHKAWKAYKAKKLM